MSLYSTVKHKDQGSESHQLFALANKRKLSDIFSNGFNVPKQLNSLLSISAIKQYNYLHIEPVFSLFDMILLAITDCNNDDFYNVKVSHSTWYIVFKNASHKEIVGFTNQVPTYQKISKLNVGMYSISIKNSMQYAFVHKSIKKYLCSVKMLFERAVNTNKVILKSNLTRSNVSDKTLVKSIKSAFISEKKTTKETPANLDFLKNLNKDVNQQMDAILTSDSSSILNLPIEYDLSFPSGDLTQLQLLYKSMQEELGAVLEMPLTKLFGTPPVGFQSTGEYDRLSYEQTLDRIANEYVVPILRDIGSILNLSDSEKESIKYLSTYQIEILMKLINMTAGNSSPQVQKMIEEYIEIKTGIKAEKVAPIPTNDVGLADDVSIADNEIL